MNLEAEPASPGAFTPVSRPTTTADAPLVLIVEDERPLRDLLGHLFERDGYRVRKASNGAEALSFLSREGAPHVAFVDLLMPVLDGARFLRQAFATGHRFPAALVSASPEAAAVAAELGIGHIAKPYDWRTLRAWAEDALAGVAR